MKKTRSIAIVVLTALLSLVLLTACGKATGKYKFKSMSGQGMTVNADALSNYGMSLDDFSLELKSDGTFAMTAMGEAQEGKWTQSGSKVSLTAEDTTIEGTIKGKTLTIAEDGMSMEFEKQ